MSRTVYDSKGRTVWADEPHLAGRPSEGTRTVYDGLDRVRETQRFAEVIIEIVDDEDNPGQKMSQLAAHGDELHGTSNDYDNVGRVISTTDAAGHLTTFDYDKAGRQTDVHDWFESEDRQTHYDYDAAGRRTLVRDPLGHETKTVYDAAGRVIKTIFADQNFTLTNYDELGHKLTETDQLGLVTNYRYDEFGQLDQVALPAVHDPETAGGHPLVHPTYNYVYDVYGNLTEIHDAKGRVTLFSFDQFNRQLTRQLPDVTGLDDAIESMTYDDFGRVLDKIDFKGQRAHHVYDPADVQGRLTSIEYFAVGASTPAETVDYAYDDVDSEGNRTDTITDARGETSSTFDPQGRLIQVFSPEGTINYAYNLLGQHTSTWTDYTQTDYHYNSLGQLETVASVKRNGTTLASPEVTSYEYDDVGMLKTVTLPNGVTSDYEYDALNRLLLIVHRDAVDTLLAEFQYTMRDNGQRSGVVETLRDESNVLTSRQVDYIYDNIGRLIEEISQSTAPALQYDTKYTLDLVGNRLQKETIQGGDTDVIDYLYNSRDELRTETPSHNGTTGAVTNYDYDLNGSRIEKTTVGGDSASYTFNLRNRLSGATIDRIEAGHAVHAETNYVYDDFGLRVSTDEVVTVDNGTPITTHKVFLTDANNPTGYTQILEERPSATSSPTMTYVIGQDVLSQASGAVSNFLLVDGVGSTRSVADSAAAIAVTYSYDAYGIQITNAATTLLSGVTSLRYTGEQFDSVLQQTYLRARYLDPASGVFSSRDSINGAVGTPLSLHQTSYVHADPLNNHDPSGHWAQALLFAGIVGFGYGAIRELLSPDWTAASVFGSGALYAGMGIGLTGGFLAIGAGATATATWYGVSTAASEAIGTLVSSLVAYGLVTHQAIKSSPQIQEDLRNGNNGRAILDVLALAGAFTGATLGAGMGGAGFAGALSDAMNGRLASATYTLPPNAKKGQLVAKWRTGRRKSDKCDALQDGFYRKTYKLRRI